MATKEIAPVPVDSPESRRYNRIKRWLGIADFAIGFGLLIVLLATGWSGTLRDLAERGASQNYPYAVFLYVVMLMLISKALGTPLEYYSFRLEHRYNLSNQRFAVVDLGRVQRSAHRPGLGHDCGRIALHAHTRRPRSTGG